MKTLIVSFVISVLAASGVATRAQQPETAGLRRMTKTEFDRAFTHHTAEANGVRLHYVTGGKRGGDLVALLHGFPQTWYAWRGVIPTLAENYTVVAPDLRGMGDSARSDSGYEKRSVAEDIYRLARELGYERFYLVGHDFGGSVAYALAAAHPEAVRKLVLIECLPAGLLAPEAVQKAVAEKFGERGWFPAFHQVRDLPEELVKGRERIYLDWFYDNFTFNKSAITPDDRAEYARRYSKPGAMHVAFEYYRTQRQDAEQNRALLARAKLTMPVLVFGGDASYGDTTQRAVEVAATDVRGEVLKDCGHFVPEERPEIIAPKITAFFGEDGR